MLSRFGLKKRSTLISLVALLFLMVAIPITVNLAFKSEDQVLTPEAVANLPVGFTESAVVTGLVQPTAMEFASDRRLFVAEKSGTLRVIKNDQLLASPFLTVSVNAVSERGLLGVAFDPDYQNNGFVYVYYTRSSSPIKNRVSRFTTSSSNSDVAVSGSEIILVDNIPSDAGNHNAGAIHFGADGKLYIATGDGGSNATNSQNLGNLAGKILRINKNGTIPSDNPFVGQSGAREEIWVYGLRNPFTFAVDPITGKIFANDVGAGSWEEVNDIQKGKNYGWPNCEGPFGSGVGDCTNAAFTYPIHAYTHSVGRAITGGTFYNSNKFPAIYNGTYFFADYLGGFIKNLDPNNGNLVTDFASGVGGTVDLKEGLDGALYYLNLFDGTVYKAQPGANPGDINNDGQVNIFDLSILLSSWNTSDATADINNDGIVNIFDLSILLSNWSG